MDVDPEELIRSDEAAKMLGLKPATLTTWRHYGRGPKYLKIGRLAYYRRADIRAFLGTLVREPIDNSRGAAA